MCESFAECLDAFLEYNDVVEIDKQVIIKAEEIFKQRISIRRANPRRVFINSIACATNVCCEEDLNKTIWILSKWFVHENEKSSTEIDILILTIQKEIFEQVYKM